MVGSYSTRNLPEVASGGEERGEGGANKVVETYLFDDEMGCEDC